MKIVLIHGSNYDKRCWFLVKKFLKEECLAIELFDHADFCEFEKASFKRWSEQIYKQLSNNGIEECILVGHSLASGTIMKMCENHADIIKGVIFISSPIPYNNLSIYDSLPEQNRAFLDEIKNRTQIIEPFRYSIKGAKLENVIMNCLCCNDSILPFFENVCIQSLRNVDSIGYIILEGDQAIPERYQYEYIKRIEQSFGKCIIKRTVTNTNHNAVVTHPKVLSKAIMEIVLEFERISKNGK